MRRLLAAILLVSCAVLLLAGCREPARHAVEATPPAPDARRSTAVARPAAPEAARAAPPPVDAGVAAATAPSSDARTACVDAWLAARHLDRWGQKAGTMYVGGTPEFDETTGTRTDRWTVLARNRPDALAACPPGR